VSGPELPNTVFAWNRVTQKSVLSASNDVAHFTYSFSNISTNPVTITGAEAMCSYARLELPALPWTIQPGETGEISVIVNAAGKKGKIIRVVQVHTDQGSKALLFEIVKETTNAVPKTPVAP